MLSTYLTVNCIDFLLFYQQHIFYDHHNNFNNNVKIHYDFLTQLNNVFFCYDNKLSITRKSLYKIFNITQHVLYEQNILPLHRGFGVCLHNIFNSNR